MPASGVLFAESAHAADFRMARRTESYHKLIYLLAGAVRYTAVGAKPLAVKAGSILLVPRGVPHALADQATSVLLLLCLRSDLRGLDAEMHRLWAGLTAGDERRLTLGRPARQQLESMWRRGLAEREHMRPGADAAQRALAVQTLVLLARLPAVRTEAAPSASARVAAVRREMQETFFEPWNVDEAAVRAGLSRRRFTELFRELAGETFWKNLNRRRLDHAARLLRRGEHSIFGVMFSCGFNDLSHFYRMFRQRFGAPPRAWRKTA